ncbi:hypothetical protein ACJIZ3_019671 [Penstemon smallii]|uniref:Uncharacterized protein n=1 Tax=Penstemon smallii TaxID=265156 RepID=A0ABD3T1U5_9LAMI
MIYLHLQKDCLVVKSPCMLFLEAEKLNTSWFENEAHFLYKLVCF